MTYWEAGGLSDNRRA